MARLSGVVDVGVRAERQGWPCHRLGADPMVLGPAASRLCRARDRVSIRTPRGPVMCVQDEMVSRRSVHTLLMDFILRAVLGSQLH